MKNIEFVSHPETYNPDDAFVVHLLMVICKEGLLNQLNEKLKFPYFGFNWDALFDLLRDFHWIEKKRVVLVHDDLPTLDKRELKIYLEILVDSIRDWKEGEEHSFEVVFPESTKELICSVLL